MILYTPIATNDIFPTNDEVFNKRQCVSYAGKTLYVEETSSGDYQLLQLISTDPQDFMDVNYSPGVRIR